MEKIKTFVVVMIVGTILAAGGGTLLETAERHPEIVAHLVR